MWRLLEHCEVLRLLEKYYMCGSDTKDHHFYVLTVEIPRLVWTSKHTEIQIIAKFSLEQAPLKFVDIYIRYIGLHIVDRHTNILLLAIGDKSGLCGFDYKGEKSPS